MKAYQQIAYVYDQLMEDAPYGEWLNFTKNVIANNGGQAEVIADLGCGTGEITTRLAQQGYRMYGVDYSADMLTCADQKAHRKQLSITWLKQDLRNLVGLENIDVAISYCDVMNYITSESELRHTFNHIYECLCDKGLFIFDVHSLYHVQNKLINQTFTHVTDDFSYIWFCLEGDELGEMHHELTFFSMTEDGSYVRFDEDHYQRTYHPAIYKQLLLDTGFKNIHMYSDFSLKNKHSFEQTTRIFFVAKK